MLFLYFLFNVWFLNFGLFLIDIYILVVWYVLVSKKWIKNRYEVWLSIIFFVLFILCLKKFDSIIFWVCIIKKKFKLKCNLFW